ncbi:MAG: HAD family hydrolase [Candidatus Hydrogenedentes bacterium]|nr:HAD family hydrolase [Candidatus Hydrogenedentota bacterium]
MTTQYIPGTDIRILRETKRGKFKYGLFDFDGTVSLLREGWQQVMGPLCVEMICGDHPHTPEIEKAVEDYIAESTGINTILQMEHLVKMVRDYGFVPEEKILDAHGYKAIYNDRLMVRVKERIARLQTGDLPVGEVVVKGSLEFVKALYDRGLEMYIFSGTDIEDVQNESRLVGAAQYFTEIWGALRTYQESNKEKIIKNIIAQHDLHGTEVLVVGDGPVEIRLAHEHGCVSVGVCSDELRGYGWNEEKVDRLTKAGADILVSDFSEVEPLIEYLFPS